MKIVSSTQMQAIEKKAMAEGFNEEDFMDLAGRHIALEARKWVEQHHIKKSAILLIGKGNNGGDAAVAGQALLEAGYDVFALLALPLEKCSPLCQKKVKRLLEKGAKSALFAGAFPLITEGFILDGLFGTGLNQAPKGAFAELIRLANDSGLAILAIDIPSGLSGDTGEAFDPCIHAAATFYLELPKLGFFLRDGFDYVGDLIKVFFGLPQDVIQGIETPFWLVQKEEAFKAMPKMPRRRHKYQAGVVAILAGSEGMAGAGLLAAVSALKSGAGLVRLYYPEKMASELSKSPYELIKVPYQFDEGPKIAEEMNKAHCIALGPGIGQSKEMEHFIKELLPHLKKPCVLDADALNLIGKHQWGFPAEAILTPHLGEMKRLLPAMDAAKVDLHLLEQCQEFVLQNQVILVLKGAPTFIFCKQKILVSTFGDPGMATAGSGDVLTGLVASLKAQGMSLDEAAFAGPVIHGLSGEAAALSLTPYCMTASDIIHFYPNVYAALILANK